MAGVILDDPQTEPETPEQRAAAFHWFNEWAIRPVYAVCKPSAHERDLLVHATPDPVGGVAPGPVTPAPADPPISRVHPAEHAMNGRHGWHCPCVACRIDRGED